MNYGEPLALAGGESTVLRRLTPAARNLVHRRLVIDIKMSETLTDELLSLNQALLDSIADGDWVKYQSLCDPSLTAFEPEAVGNLVAGMDFHHFYFRMGGMGGRRQTTMSSPHVRIMGDTAVICCVRLIQRQIGDEPPTTSAFEETRVWQRQDDGWKHVHFHRSKLPSS